MIRSLSIGFACLGCMLRPGLAAAQEADLSLDDRLPAPLANASVYFDLDTAAFLEETERDGSPFAADGAAGVELTGPVGSAFEISVIPEMRWSAGSDIASSRAEFLEDSTKRPLFTFREAWVAAQAGPFTIKIGKQIQRWGTGELYSPSDDLNAYDQLDPPDAYKIGEPMVMVRYASEALALEAVAIPWFTPDRLPQLDSRWARSTENAADIAESLTGIRPAVELGTRTLPDGFEPVQYGLRLTTSSLIGGTDLFVSGFRGVSRVPIFEPRLDSPRLLTFDAEYPEYSEVAAGFSSIIGSFAVHGEAAWHLSEDTDRNDDYIAFVVGFRRGFDVAGGSALTNVRLTVEYAGEIVTRRRDMNAIFINSLFDRPTDNSVLGTIEFEFGQDTSASVGTIVNFDDGDHAVEAGIRHRLNDRFTVRAGFRVFGGPADSFFGEWRRNDHAFAAVAFRI